MSLAVREECGDWRERETKETERDRERKEVKPVDPDHLLDSADLALEL